MCMAHGCCKSNESEPLVPPVMEIEVRELQVHPQVSPHWASLAGLTFQEWTRPEFCACIPTDGLVRYAAIYTLILYLDKTCIDLVCWLGKLLSLLSRHTEALQGLIWAKAGFSQ